MRVSVFGLGYVGAVSCGCFAKDGHEVIGVDLNEDKVRLINEGKTPIIEEQIGEIIAEAVKEKRLRAISDVHEAVANTDISVVSVGTPSNADGSLGLHAVERVSEQIGEAIAKKDGRHLVMMRSTVLPGTVRNIVIPQLEKGSGKKNGEDFGTLFNPEFLREGSSVKDHYNPPFTLLGCDNEEDGKTVSALYEKVGGEMFYSSIETAEMVKYVCNCFHALKVTFATEMGILAQSMNVDSHQVMELICKDTKLNLSPYYMKPGFAFGGSCLPKDVKALIAKGRSGNLTIPLVDSIMDSNKKQIERAIEMILSYGKKKVSILGLSFKAGTDDLRESPLVKVTEALIGKGYDIRIYDKNVSVAALVGANRTYIEKEIPHISSLMTPDLKEAVNHGELLIIGNGSEEFKSDLPGMLTDQTVFDLVKIKPVEAKEGITYKGVTW